MKHRALTWVGCTVAVALVLGAATWGTAMDVELLRLRLTSGDASIPGTPLAVDAAYWLEGDQEQDDRRGMAARVARKQLSEQLTEWSKGGALQQVERFRNTDFELFQEGGEASDDGMGLAFRMSERIHLKMTGAGLKRELVYDPFSRRMWMDVFQQDLPLYRTNISVTNTYEVDEAANRFLLKVNRSFE
ncbi:MAG: hypothetical protein ACE5FN_00645 [Leptospirillia bacterium]